MILFALPAKTEGVTPHWLTAPRRFRWALEIVRWGVELAEQVELPRNQPAPYDHSVGWHYALRYFGIFTTPHFWLGRRHIYYDGPHCSFSLGWLHLCWSLGHCRICEAGMT